MDSQAAQLQEAKIEEPTPCGLSHIAIPSRDLNQSKQFFIDVLGGNLTVDAPALARVRFGNFAIVLRHSRAGRHQRMRSTLITLSRSHPKISWASSGDWKPSAFRRMIPGAE